MVTHRIIPCLDVDEGRVVKGVKFKGIRDAGDPVELARRYNEQNADELTFLDIGASLQKPANHAKRGGAGIQRSFYSANRRRWHPHCR